MLILIASVQNTVQRHPVAPDTSCYYLTTLIANDIIQAACSPKWSCSIGLEPDRKIFPWHRCGGVEVAKNSPETPFFHALLPISRVLPSFTVLPLLSLTLVLFHVSSSSLNFYFLFRSSRPCIRDANQTAAVRMQRRVGYTADDKCRRTRSVIMWWQRPCGPLIGYWQARRNIASVRAIYMHQVDCDIAWADCASVCKERNIAYNLTQTDILLDNCMVVYCTSVVFTARCTLVQSEVLQSHVVCLSVRLSVRLWRWWIVIT